jgi:phospholipase/carboxylesterase
LIAGGFFLFLIIAARPEAGNHRPMENETQPMLEIGATNDEAQLSVILMHGLGADGHDFADVATALSDAALPSKWRFVLPHAPEQAVTINMGMTMPAWYDIIELDHPRSVNWETVEESCRAIERLLEGERAEKIVLAGFSQGAAMALHVGLRRQSEVAGVLMMSGYLLESEEHPCPKKSSDIPIGIFHGSEDPVVPFKAAEDALAELDAGGYSTLFKAYQGMEHSLCDEEIRDAFEWLQRA